MRRLALEIRPSFSQPHQGPGVMLGSITLGLSPALRSAYNADRQSAAQSSHVSGCGERHLFHKRHSEFQDSGAGWYHQDSRLPREPEASQARSASNSPK